MAEGSKQVSNDIWNCLRALRDGMLDTVTLKRQQADEILRTNELLQKMVCDCTNKLMSEAADALAEQAETIQRLRDELETERLRLAGCGVAALADTPRTAAERLTRESSYWSASCGDVCHMVDRLMEMRAALEWFANFQNYEATEQQAAYLRSIPVWAEGISRAKRVLAALDPASPVSR